MKHRNHRRGSTAPVDIEFARALADSGVSSSQERQAQRKARQLCRQVQRALNMAFADRSAEALYVEDVTPAPDCGHLLVHVVVPAGRSVGDVLAGLREDVPRLRAEVAAAIARKRTPELSFIPAMPTGAGDE